MARFALVGPAYRSQSVTADCQTLMNLYLETIESGQGKGPAALYCTPGLNKLYDLGKAGLRGEWYAQGRAFAVAGTTLWELLAPNANPNKINRGNVVSDGQPVSMASGPTQVLIASSGNLYCFQLVAGTSTAATGVPLLANSLTQIPQFNAGTGLGLLGNVSQVVYSDGFFFALIANSNQIQGSSPLDGSSWQGVTETQVSVFADNVSAIYVNARRLWVFGPLNIQAYFDSGNFPFPYDVDQSGFIEAGLLAPFSVTKLDNSIFWIGQDARGANIVFRLNGYTPQRISTHALEYAFSTYPTIADAVCYAYQEQGHTFYVINLPTAQKTWAYDCATQSWGERGYWNAQAGVFTQSRAGFHIFAFGVHLVGDPTTGAVYQQSASIYSDNGNPIRRLRRAPHISNEQARIFFTELQLDVEVGIGPTFPGQATPTVVPMLDAAGVLRNFGVGENGILQAPPNLTDDASFGITLYLNDQANTTSWQILINAIGEIAPVQLPAFVDSYPQAIPFVTALGDQRWTLQLKNLGAGIAVLVTIPQGIVGRGPEIILKWSNDGAKTFSDGRALDCGQAGETLTRVIARQLGSARDRVFEISMTDPIPWRIIDAYLFTDPEDKQPSSRYASELRKRA